MTAIIVANDSSGTTTNPQLVVGYETARTSRNVLHDLIGGGAAVSLIAPRLRSGVLTLLYAAEADGFAALAMHARETYFTLSDTDIPDIAMSYVLSESSDVQLSLDPDSVRVWLLTVPYQEIVP